MFFASILKSSLILTFSNIIASIIALAKNGYIGILTKNYPTSVILPFLSRQLKSFISYTEFRIFYLVGGEIYGKFTTSSISSDFSRSTTVSSAIFWIYGVLFKLNFFLSLSLYNLKQYPELVLPALPARWFAEEILIFVNWNVVILFFWS